MITNHNFDVDLANLSDKKLRFEIAKEMNFDKYALGDRSSRDRSLIRLLDSLKNQASGFSTIFFPHQKVLMNFVKE